MKNITLTSIRKHQQSLLKKRLISLFKNKLPRTWISLFIHDNPQYIGNSKYFTEVKRAGTIKTGGVIPSGSTINDLEVWIKKNKTIKQKKVK